jgi:hypothetical protein
MRKVQPWRIEPDSWVPHEENPGWGNRGFWESTIEQGELRSIALSQQTPARPACPYPARDNPQLIGSTMDPGPGRSRGSDGPRTHPGSTARHSARGTGSSHDALLEGNGFELPVRGRGESGKMHEGRKQTNTGPAHAGSRLKLTDALGRRCPKCHPSSRTGENPPYGMIGGSRCAAALAYGNRNRHRGGAGDLFSRGDAEYGLGLPSGRPLPEPKVRRCSDAG